MKESYGRKVSAIAELFFVCIVLLSVIALIVFLVSEQFLVGIIIAAVSVFCGYVSYVFLSAFGELVEETTKNRMVNEEILTVLKNSEEEAKAYYSLMRENKIDTKKTENGKKHSEITVQSVMSVSQVKDISEFVEIAMCADSNKTMLDMWKAAGLHTEENSVITSILEDACFRERMYGIEHQRVLATIDRIKAMVQRSVSEADMEKQEQMQSNRVRRRNTQITE